MLTALVRASLVVELAAWVLLAAWLQRQSGWAAAAGVVAVPFAIRFVLVGVTFLVSWAWRSPRPPGLRLGPWGSACLVAGELRAVLADNFLYLPWPSRALRPDPKPSAAAGVPVVLVHGYFSNRAYFAPLVRWLESCGVTAVHAPDFTPVFSSIEAFARELHDRIESIVRQSGGQGVVLVCHSMGGIAARLYLKEHGEGRVARLVTIASPHEGTILALAGIGEHARQMRRGSALLEGLAQEESKRPPRLPAVSVYSVHDNLVAPQDTSRLPWARNVALGGVGHLGILGSERIRPLLLEELRAAGAAA